MESIQQIGEQFIRETMAIDITQGLTGALETARQLTGAFICRIMEHKLMEIDQALFETPSLRKGWVVEHRDVPRELLTGHGLLQFNRRYYRNKKTCERRCLVDDLVGLEPYERVETGLAAKLCEAAVDHSYQKSSKVCCDSQVSRQTVMNKTRQVTRCALEPVEMRRDVPVIHIQADEDHVAMQDGRQDAIVKLVAIHEPAHKIGKKRWRLPQRHLLTSYGEAVDDFWLRVADALYERYGDRDDLQVYIHGDGASWIKTGLDWIKNSHFVLDKYHFLKYLSPVVGDKEGYRQYILGELDGGSRLKIDQLVEAIVESDGCSREAGERFLSYMHGNWKGIQIWYDGNHQAGPSCAEGLVSHVLSSRLSSRPLGWRDEGLETISRLRVHVLNGGRIGPENLRKDRKPAIKATKKLRQRLSFDIYNESRILHTDHRTSAQYRLFKAITSGGCAI
jgi:hypothetical protein